MSSMWIFGYGSLCWRPGFDYNQKRVGYIRDFKRVWYQGSTDHRGTIERPGRTVTLIEECGARCVGVAYELAGNHEKVKATLAYLEEREKQYDQRHQCDFMSMDGSVAVEGCLVYIATQSERNRNWLGPAPLHEIADTIATSQGPSGPNCDYIYELANAMRELGVDDEELFQLEALVRVRID